MTVELAWADSSQSIKLCTSYGKWTWEEYHTALSQMVQQFQQIPHRVDLIITRAPNSTMPSGSAMPHFQRAVSIMPSNVGLVVLVNKSGFSSALVSVFSRVFVARATPKFIIVGSTEEAQAAIAAHRADSGQQIELAAPRAAAESQNVSNP